MTSGVLGDLSAMRDSTGALLLGLDAEPWHQADVRAPSLLPGWTRGHVLSHIARNADGITRTLNGALRGEIVARYPQGQAGRTADIEDGAGRTAPDLIADVRRSAVDLDRIFTAIAESDGWQLRAEDRTAATWVTSRWREVEIHRVDLDRNYGPQDWPPAFVSYLLPALAVRLARRTQASLRVEITAEGSVSADVAGHAYTTADDVDGELVAGPDWAVLAWLTGRVDVARDALSAAPELTPWL